MKTKIFFFIYLKNHLYISEYRFTRKYLIMELDRGIAIATLIMVIMTALFLVYFNKDKMGKGITIGGNGK